MGQGYSLTTLSAGSAGIDVPELLDLVYEKSVGGGRFMKSIRARQQNGLVFVKVIMKPYPSLKLEPYVKAIIRERKLLAEVPNALGYQRILETSVSGYLVRQYMHSSLYDRISTRPFLENIEKKWLAFQLLCALRDCHALDIFHGDIKTENILVTSWNWLYLSDFSSSFKPTFLPEDNPADFSFYFDTSGRRTCYLAPERFLVAGEEPGNRSVNWAMDIFSAGCVIAEFFLESPIFTLSQMYKYRKGEYSPEHSQVSKIEDPEIREMILHMIQLDPESRYSAEEYLNFWKNKAFPEYFYSFLHQYMAMMTDPSSGRAHVEPETANRGEADDRIERIHFDFDKISYFLGAATKATEDYSRNAAYRLTGDALPVQLDLPGYAYQTSRALPQAEDGALIFLTLVVSSLRNTSKSSARAKACDILLAFAERLSDEAKLDRVLPYVMLLLNDSADTVKIAAIRTLSQLLEMVQVVSPVNAYLFPEYIFPRLKPLVATSKPNTSPIVRATYASCIASLAQSSIKFLDMIQALRSDTRLTTLISADSDPKWTEDATYHNLYDVARADLLDYFEIQTKTLLTDTDASVRRAFLGSVSSLCVFFGNAKANEVILGHLNTYLNDKDWILKCAFFEAVVGVAAFVGSISLEQYILPLMIQSMTEPEEFVVERVIRSLATMAEMGLFQRSTTWDLLQISARFLIHPNQWIRNASVDLIVNSTKYLSAADKHSILTPLVRPFLKIAIIDFSKTHILDAMKRPLARNVYEIALVWVSKVEKGIFWKNVNADGAFTLGISETVIPRPHKKNQTLASLPTNEEDEQWLVRLRNLGMGPEDEFKLFALREYLWRVSLRQTKESAVGAPARLNNIIALTQYGVTPQTVFFDKTQNIQPRRAPSDKTELRSTSEHRSHTIADALLDASTTIDSAAHARRQHTRSRSQNPKETGALLVPRPSTAREAIPTDHSPDMSPLASSPTAAPQSHPLTSPPSDERRVSISRQSPGYESSSTATEPDNPLLKKLNSGIQRKPSAISLLRKDTTKAFAETSMSSANAFGKVDVPSQRQTPQPSALSLARDQRSSPSGPRHYHASHSYGGNDPVILRLLDSVFAENYPTDFFDFGPYVKDVDVRRPIKKASGQESGKIWKPSGNLVAVFGEHSGPVNRVAVAPDHSFFVTASNDGTVKVWDTMRLEKNLTPRSRQTHRHALGAKVKALTFAENTHTFISGATDGSIHAVKVDYHKVNDVVRYGKLQLVRDYQLPVSDDGTVEYPVWMEHFRSEAQSTLLVATNISRILALDMKTMEPVYTLQNPVHHGALTTFCCDRKHNWLVAATMHGVLNLWDLRFRVRLRAWGLPGAGTIHRVQVHPTKGRGRWICVAANGAHSNEITVWDVEKVQCREVYQAFSPSLSSTPSSSSRNGANGQTSAREAHVPTWKAYEAWRVDGERPEGMLARFANTGPGPAGTDTPEPLQTGQAILSPTTGGDRPGIRAFAVGFDSLEDGKDSSKYGFIISAGSDRKIRFWDLARPELSTIVSGLEAGSGDGNAVKPRYEVSQPIANMLVTTEYLPGTSPGVGPGGSGAKKGSSGRPPRSTVISLQQQQLLKNHLDSIQDVAFLRVPYGMTVSVDRAGVVYVFQ